MLSKKKIELAEITKEYSNKELKMGCLVETFQLDFGQCQNEGIRLYDSSFTKYDEHEESGWYYDTIIGDALSLPTLLRCITANITEKNRIYIQINTIIILEKYVLYPLDRVEKNIKKTDILAIFPLKDPINMTDEEIQNVLDLFIKIGIGQNQNSDTK